MRLATAQTFTTDDKMPYNKRATVGKKKGQFTKEKVQKQLEALIKRNEERKSKKTSEKLYEGRRVVEFDKLAEQLWCNVCNDSLSLRYKLQEKIIGLASIIKIKYHRCNMIMDVTTSSKSDKFYYDVNKKMANGMYDHGTGPSGVNSFLSALNVPVVKEKCLKRYERQVGPSIEKLAEQSCREAIEIEKILTKESNLVKKYAFNESNENGNTINLIASYDAAWTKRGRQYNSFSGHSTIIGYFSDKVLSYACKDKQCRKCTQNCVKPHDCKKNHNGSSKSMEIDMAVELVLKNKLLVDSNCKIRCLIADEDSSAIASLRRLSPYTITKWSDFNHTHKTWNSKLYDIKLPAKLREYFSKAFSLAVKPNKGDELNVKIALENIVPHAFGQHTNCGPWCKSEEGNHYYKYFKNNEPLSDDKLKDKLISLVQPFINKASQIAPCASSQSNESFNNIAYSKHPKSFYYGGSESHTVRVALAVCQKNLGAEYIIKLNKALNLSPGKFTKKYRETRQKKRLSEAVKKKSIPVKRRRLFLKKERCSKNATCTSREGITYQSESGYLNTSHLIDETLIADNIDYKDCALVIFDTEITGFHISDEIIADMCGDETFNIYIMPQKNMSPNASNVTGITITNGEMYVNDEKVITSTARKGFLSFLYFKKKITKPIILLSHNCFRFDAKRVLNLARKVGLFSEMQMFVKGFSDSLPIFQEILPNRKKDKKSFSQAALTLDFLEKNEIEMAHNAINDVRMLQLLIRTLNVKSDVIIKHTCGFNFIANTKERDQRLKEIKRSLSDLNISKHMQNKIAKSGIDVPLLRKACLQGGYDGLRLLLTEDIGKKPRVTNNTKIIKQLFLQISNESTNSS
ncbi:uncharacterized protein [Prorops nasuta]|uniref:uncharacterized protein n=1 Tax=Prorops nasuta TaxID=863751 RepID=UPI0034CDCD6A